MAPDSFDYNKLATRTAKCMLGIDCGTDSVVSGSSGTDIGTGTGAGFGGTSAGAGGKNDGAGGKNDGAGGPNAEVNIKQTIEAAMAQMASDDKQQQMNQRSKGPYFLIFILFLLLFGFSLDKDENDN